MIQKGLIAIAALALLSSSAYGETKAVATATTGIIAESDSDYDRDGVEEKLYVRMTSGELKEEQEPGPFTGVHWEGEFRLELVAKDGTPLHTLNLNPAFGSESLVEKGEMEETLFAWQGDRFIRTEYKESAPPPDPETQSTSAMQWSFASADIEKLYDRFVEEKDDELLRELSPLDVFRFYVKASEAGDYSTQYALYIKDSGYEVPSYKSFLNDISHDQGEADRSRQKWAELRSSYALTEEIDGNQALIRMSDGNGSKEDEKGFQLIQSEDGIWKAAWMPMQ